MGASVILVSGSACGPFVVVGGVAWTVATAILKDAALAGDY